VTISYVALTRNQKRELARELRPSTTVRDLAELLHVSVKAIVAWTRDLKVDLRQERPGPINPEDLCSCTAPVSDRRVDAACRRRPTCILCGRPGGRS
jgi:hypothetical protein